MATENHETDTTSTSPNVSKTRFGCLFNAAFVVMVLVSLVVIGKTGAAWFPWHRFRNNHEQGDFYLNLVSYVLAIACWLPILWTLRKRKPGTWFRPAFLVIALLAMRYVMIASFIGPFVIHEIASQHVIRHLAPIARAYRSEHGELPQRVDEILPWYLRPANALAYPIEFNQNELEYNGDWVLGEDWTTYNIDTNEWAMKEY